MYKYIILTSLFFGLLSCSSEFYNIESGDRPEELRNELLLLDNKKLIKLAYNKKTSDATLRFLASEKDSNLSLASAILSNPNSSLKTIGIINSKFKSNSIWSKRLEYSPTVVAAKEYCKSGYAEADSLAVIASCRIQYLEKYILKNNNADIRALSEIYKNNINYESKHPLEKEYRKHQVIKDAYSYAQECDNTDSLLIMAEYGIETIDWALAANPNSDYRVLDQIIKDIFEGRYYDAWYDTDKMLSLFSILLQNKNMAPETIARLNADWVHDASAGLNYKNRIVYELIATHPNTPSEILEELANNEDKVIATSVAANTSTNAETLDLLSERFKDNGLLLKEVAGHKNTSRATIERIIAGDDLQALIAVYNKYGSDENIFSKLNQNPVFQPYLKTQAENTPDVFELLKKNMISVSIMAKGIDYFELKISSRRKNIPDFIIPAACWFESTNSDMQDMISRYAVYVNIPEDLDRLINVPVVCAEHSKDVPQYGNMYYMQKAPENSDLDKIVSEAARQGIDNFSVLQAATWILTDNIGFNEISQLNRNGRGMIDEEDCAEAIKLIYDAGIDLKGKEIIKDAQAIYMKTGYNSSSSTWPCNVFLRKWLRDNGVYFYKIF